MIFELKISAIVMVTDRVDGGKEKYVQYWPLNKNGGGVSRKTERTA